MTALRVAVPADARALSRLAEHTFREAFSDMNSPQDMDLHCRTSYGEQIQAAEIADPLKLTLLAEGRDSLAGYAQLRWGKAPACVGGSAPGEIQRIYVVREWHGKGIAHSLMGACLEALAVRGSDVAWLGVWERNPRAIAFYRKIGFAECGTQVFTLGNDPQRDLVMARRLREHP